MKIQTITNQQPPVTHKGGIKSLNKFNPIARYADRYFTNMAKTSADRIEAVIPSLAGKIQTVRINNISAWNINPENKKEYILFLHGMSQNVSNYQHLYETILSKDKGIFAVEYRGYGENERAKTTEDKLRKDVKTAYNYLTQEKGIKPEDITVIGHSMGGALAADFASKHHDLKALILICPLTKMSYLGKKFSAHKILGFGAPESLIRLTKQIKPLAWLYDLKFNSINKIPKIKTPTYYIQSRNDSVTTLQGARIFAKTARKAKILQQFVSLPLGGHKVDPEKIKSISAILDRIYS